jgi:hypothetical protein
VPDLAKHETSRSVVSKAQRTSDFWPAHKRLNAAGSESAPLARMTKRV